MNVIRSLKTRPRRVVLWLFVLSALFLGSCGVWPASASDWVYQLPERGYYPGNKSCIGHYQDTKKIAGINVGQTDEILEGTIIGWDKNQETLILVGPSGDGALTEFEIPIEAFVDMEAVVACSQEHLGVSAPGENTSYEYYYYPQTMTSENYSETPEAPSTYEVFIHLDLATGERTEYPTEHDAQNAALAQSGESIVLRYDSGTGAQEALYTVPPWEVPPELQALADSIGVTIDPSFTYYHNVNTGEYFIYQEEAHQAALERPEASSIYSGRRGILSQEPVVTVGEFITPPGLNTNYPADLEYYGVHTTPGGELEGGVYYPTDQKDELFNMLMNRTQGGALSVWKRGVLVNNQALTVNPWEPNECWREAFEGFENEPPLGTRYYMYDGKCYAFQQDAVAAAQNNHDGAIYYGGSVLSAARDLIWTAETVEIPSWVRPDGLPDGWDAEQPYYVRNGVAYPTLSEAIASNWLGWFVSPGDSIQPMLRNAFSGGVYNPPASWLRWVVIAVALFWWLFYLLSKRKLKEIEEAEGKRPEHLERPKGLVHPVTARFVVRITGYISQGLWFIAFVMVAGSAVLVGVRSIDSLMILGGIITAYILLHMLFGGIAKKYYTGKLKERILSQSEAPARAAADKRKRDEIHRLLNSNQK